MKQNQLVYIVNPVGRVTKTQKSVKRYRKAHDITAAQAAELTYTTERTWYRYENENLTQSAFNNLLARFELLQFKVGEVEHDA